MTSDYLAVKSYLDSRMTRDEFWKKASDGLEKLVKSTPTQRASMAAVAPEPITNCECCGQPLRAAAPAVEDAPRTTKSEGDSPHLGHWSTTSTITPIGEDAMPRTSTNHVTCLCDSCRNATPRTPLRDAVNALEELHRYYVQLDDPPMANRIAAIIGELRADTPQSTMRTGQP